MRRPFASIVDPTTGLFSTRATQGLPMGPPPLVSRGAVVRNARYFRQGFGNVPNSSGAAGPLIAPYDETSIFNPPGGSSGYSSPVTDPNAPTQNPSQTGYLPPSTPYGESDRPWTNPSTFATVPINAQTNTQVPVLSQNYRRNALIIQNGSTATGTDVAPTLYVGFNVQPLVGSSLALAPGQGIAWDVITPRDSIFIAFGPFIDTGGSVVIQGAVIMGTFSP